MLTFASWLSLLVLATTTTMTHAQNEGPVVTTKYGKIRGIYADNAAIFHGVPYASPPVGPLRWETSVDPKPWGDAIYNATEVKPACPQYHCEDLSPPLVCPPKTDEDCLYLEIFAPKDPVGPQAWPVMVYIHGGNFVHMSGGSPLFDGRILAATREVILVNINYRIGALGFLVTGETTRDAKGNYGILDQQQALKWVTENIAAFGGDTSRITLFGQSAGAQSTLIHLTMPSSASYFHNAIIESSPIAIPYKTFQEAIILGNIFADLAGCRPRDMNCLRSKTANEIAYAQYLARSKVSSLKLLEVFEPWGPFVDGTLIEAEPLKMVKAGKFQKKPIVIGSTSEETVLYIFSAWNNSVGNLKYAEVVTATYPRHVLDILIEYPPINATDERNEMVHLSTDLVFACPTRNATRLMRSLGQPDIFMYVWDHAFSFPGWGSDFFCEGRVCHGSEIVFLFHTEKSGNFSFTPAEEVISQEIMDFFTNFAKTGDPNGAGESTSNPRPWGNNKDSKSRLETESTDLKYRSELLQVLGGDGGVGGARRVGGARNQAGQQALRWPKYSPDGNWPAYRFKTPQSFIDTNYHGPYCDFWDIIGYDA